jgi:hypothetical protein
MFIREHSLEEYFLRRRLDYLDQLDTFERDDFYNLDLAGRMLPDDHRLMFLKKHYSDVMSPYELNETLKRIYTPQQYGSELIKE